MIKMKMIKMEMISIDQVDKIFCRWLQNEWLTSHRARRGAESWWSLSKHRENNCGWFYLMVRSYVGILHLDHCHRWVEKPAKQFLQTMTLGSQERLSRQVRTEIGFHLWIGFYFIMFLVSAQLFLPCHNLLNLLAAVEVLAGLGAVLGLLLLLGDGLHHLQEQLQPLLVADEALRVSPF